MKTSSLRSIAVLAACAITLACASTASATVGPANGGEPPTTKGTTNTWHFAYTPLNTGYQVCFTLYKDGQVVKDFNRNYASGFHPPEGGQCTNVAFQNSTPGILSRAESGLQNGSKYEMCAVSFENYGDGLWFMRVKTLDSCSATTIDNGAPQLTTWVGGEAQYTKNPIIPVHMQYADALSHPWSQNRNVATAKAATIGCLTREASCTPNAYVDGCSTPNAGRYSWTPGYKTNSFDCGYDFTTFADGRVTFCAYQADSALVDRPNDTNQYANQNSSAANQSNVACGNVILDRGAPTVDVGADRTVNVGELVDLSAQASDAVSGVGQIAWTFGDNTAGATGANASHTYTQPGTYVVKATTTDGAGNSGEDTAVITVQGSAPPPTGGGGGGTTPPPTGGGGGTTPPPTGGGGGTTPPPTNSTGGGTSTPVTIGGSATGSGVQTVTPAQVREVIVKEGGSAPATVDVAGLEVSAPKSLKVKRGSKLPVILETDRPGKATLALVKGAKVVAKGGITITAGGTFVVKLKLPRSVKGGAHSLRVSFTPAGAAKATSKKLNVTLKLARKAKARAASVPRVGPAAGDGPGTKAPRRK